MADEYAAEPESEQAQASQEEVSYRAGNPLKNCGLCEHFQGNAGPTPDACESVEGEISPFGYCDIYKKQPNPFGDGHQYTMQGNTIAPAPSAPSAPPPGLRIGGKAYA